MTRKEAQDRLKKAKQEIKEVKEYLKNTEDGILVPDNIHLAGGSQILFNGNKQLLNWCIESSAYRISVIPGLFAYEPHKLIPADPHNLETGCIYYHSNGRMENIDMLCFYGIYDGNGNYIYINDGFPKMDSVNSYTTTIMQAVPVED